MRKCHNFTKKLPKDVELIIRFLKKIYQIFKGELFMKAEADNNDKSSCENIGGSYKGYFEKELLNIENEIASIDEVISEMMSDKRGALNESQDSRRRSSGSPYVFTSTMWANIVAAKNARISLMKDMVSLKKIIAELNMKSKKDEDDDSRFDKVAAALFEKINNTRSSDVVDVSGHSILLDEDDEEALERLAADEYKEDIGREFDPDTVEANSEFLYMYEVNTGDIYKFDNSYNLIEQCIIDEFTLRLRNGVVAGGFLKATRQPIILFNDEKEEILVNDEWHPIHQE